MSVGVSGETEVVGCVERDTNVDTDTGISTGTGTGTSMGQVEVPAWR